MVDPQRSGIFELGPKVDRELRCESNRLRRTLHDRFMAGISCTDPRPEFNRLFAPFRPSSDYPDASIIPHRLKNSRCSDSGRPPLAYQRWPHSPKCTLSFPSCGLTIGANHMVQIYQCQDPKNASRKIKVISDEGIHIVRKGKAGHINYLPCGDYTMTDDAYILTRKPNTSYQVSLQWVFQTQKGLFKEYSSNADNGTWNKGAFFKCATLDIPSSEEQLSAIRLIESQSRSAM